MSSALWATPRISAGLPALAGACPPYEDIEAVSETDQLDAPKAIAVPTRPRRIKGSSTLVRRVGDPASRRD